MDSEKIICANCDGEGWVCGEHPKVPWYDSESCCGAASVPCSCNEECELTLEIDDSNGVETKGYLSDS